MALRALLGRPGSYRAIAAAAARGELSAFPVTLFDHVGEVYGRVERAAGDDTPEIVALRLAALVHEESPASLPAILAGSDVADLAPTVLAVTAHFGDLWKIGAPDDIRRWAAANGPHVAAILLFEVAHEGGAIPAIETAARVAGHTAELQRWVERLTGGLDRIDDLAARFRAQAIPHAEWTHRTHLTVGAWHVRHFGPDEALARLRAGIRALNDAHGTPNSPTRGYHETVTRAYVALLAEALARGAGSESLADETAAILASPLAERDVLLRFYSRERLMSETARATWVEPDLAPLTLPTATRR